MKDKKIIRVWHSGLGDACQLSTLPALFHSQGYEVWISDKTPCSDSIYELIFGLNPYVMGKTSENANCGEIPGFEYRDVCGSFIGSWEMVNGMSHVNDYPIVYYQPKEIEWMKDVVIIDTSCKTAKANYTIDILNEYLSVYKNNEKVYAVKFINYVSDGYDLGFPKTEIRDLFHYCDVIHSCKKFVCLNSGGHSLSSALKRNKNIDVDCLVTHAPAFESMYSRNNFFYPNINYIWL